jgi:hypothetical protein
MPGGTDPPALPPCLDQAKERRVMRLTSCLLALPLALAACGSPSPPPPQPIPVVINTPAPPPPVFIPAPPAASLVSQCQGLFAQALGSEPVNYSSPAVASAGGSTTIRLSAQPMSPTPVAPVQYTCSFSGVTLVAAGLS